MRAVVQRVGSARVVVESGEGAGHDEGIGAGLLALVCAEHGDTSAEADWLADKLARLRIFGDDAGKMNRSLLDLRAAGTDAGAMVVSQFTLAGDARKGNRPAFTGAAPPEVARPLVERVASRLGSEHGLRVARGVFGADMRITLVNDGPVTILLERRAGDGG